MITSRFWKNVTAWHISDYSFCREPRTAGSRGFPPPLPSRPDRPHRSGSRFQAASTAILYPVSLKSPAVSRPVALLYDKSANSSCGIPAQKRQSLHRPPAQIDNGNPICFNTIITVQKSLHLRAPGSSVFRMGSADWIRQPVPMQPPAIWLSPSRPARSAAVFCSARRVPGSPTEVSAL